MIEGITFPDFYRYRLIVPAVPKTHDPHYLTRVNADFSAFLAEVDSANIFTVGDIHIIRNISPHGLGGILIFDSSWKNFFELTSDNQRRMEEMVAQLSDILEEKFGNDFYVVTGMATSSVPGSGMWQSIAFAHLHLSLFPKNISPGDHIHGMQVQESGKPIPYTTFSFHDFQGQRLTSREWGVALSFASRYPLSQFQSQNAGRIAELLSAKNSDWVSYGTQWVVHRWLWEETTLWVCPGIWYLPAFGFWLLRETEVPGEHLTSFEEFNCWVFEYVRYSLTQ